MRFSYILSHPHLVELLVVLDSECDVPRHDPALFVVAGRISCELEDLGCEVLENGGEVDTCTDTNAGSVSTLL